MAATIDDRPFARVKRGTVSWKWRQKKCGTETRTVADVRTFSTERQGNPCGRNPRVSESVGEYRASNRDILFDSSSESEGRSDDEQRVY